MEIAEKLAVLADAAKYDASCASSGSKRKTPAGGLGNTEGMGICHSYAPDGRCISLLKLLLTNYCTYDCSYCINRISSDVKRARFLPEEVVQITLDFYKRNYIEGLFLSSGIFKNPEFTMEQMILVAKKLRVDHRFGGYIHLKAVPGVSRETLLEAGKWADRLSANIELPKQEDLNRLAPAKTHAEVKTVMKTFKEKWEATKDDKSKHKPTFARAGQTTQMIVGATESSDRDILGVSTELYDTYRLRRVYYSAFSPILHSDPSLPVMAAPLVREHRLYQADWLIRFYGFKAEELFRKNANLHLDVDPKLSWALEHPEFFPVDLQKATKEILWRVPGIGIRNVERILSIRRYQSITLEHLKTLRVSLKKVRPFVITTDHVPNLKSLNPDVIFKKTASKKNPSLQLPLFPFTAQVDAASGEF